MFGISRKVDVIAVRSAGWARTFPGMMSAENIAIKPAAFGATSFHGCRALVASNLSFILKHRLCLLAADPMPGEPWCDLSTKAK